MLDDCSGGAEPGPHDSDPFAPAHDDPFGDLEGRVASPPAAAAGPGGDGDADMEAALAASTAVDEGKVNQLMEMGFPRDKCIEALKASGGSVEAAIEQLFM